jgi:hypothetical protein
MAARPYWLDPGEGLDPLAPDFLGSLVSALDYERRRQLLARGSGSGSGSGGRRRSSREAAQSRRIEKLQRRLAAERSAKAALRSQLRTTASRARTAEKKLRATSRELAYAQRFLNRGAQKRIREQERELVRLARFEEREAAKTGRFLRSLIKTPGERSAYQRRVASTISRQIERGETPSTSRRTSVAEQRRKYAERLEQVYGDRFEGISAYFLEQPRSLQDHFIELSKVLHQDYLDNGQQNLGRDMNMFLMYH